MPALTPRQQVTRARRGIALPLVLIFMFVLSASLAAGFAVTAAEGRIDDGPRQSSSALSMAESGLQRAITDRVALGFLAKPPAAAESTRVVSSGGFTDVTVTQLRPAVGSELPLYLVRSHATRTQTGAGGEPVAEQTVAQYVVWQSGTMKVNSAWTSLSGMLKNGASGSISGIDGCGLQPTLPAVSVPSTTAAGQPGYQGSTAPLQGGPPLIDMTLGNTPTAMAANVPIDWAGIVAGTAIAPDITIPPGAYPTQVQFASDTTYWPVIIVANRGGAAFSLPYPGRGLLIITGNLVISGTDFWSGVILVGGTATSNGNNAVQGTVVSGLNVKLGDVIGVESVGNGTKSYGYNSCSIQMAMKGAGRLRPYPNTWSTKWPTY